MSLNANISENSLVSEQANVVPNKTIASRLREAHGTTGETIATAIPGAGPVMYVDTDITEVDGTTYYVLTKTFNEIKQAINNNILVVIRNVVENKEDIISIGIEYITEVGHDPMIKDIYRVQSALPGAANSMITVAYTTDDPNKCPKRQVSL